MAFGDKSSGWTRPLHTEKCVDVVHPQPRPTTPLDVALHRMNRCILLHLAFTAGDWLQGPYVYALYESYGMTTHDIEVLFVAGFGSSMLFGTVVGSVADK